MKDERLNQNDFQKETLEFPDMENVEGGGENGCTSWGMCIGDDSGCADNAGICISLDEEGEG